MNRRLALLALAVTAALVVGASPAGGSDLASDLERVRERVAFVRSQISQAAADRSATARDVLAAADALDVAQAAVDAAVAELDSVAVALDIRSTELAAVRDDLAEQLAVLTETRARREDARREAEEWVRDAYMGGGPTQPSIAFSARAVSDVGVAVAYLEVLTGHSSSAADRLATLVTQEESEEAGIRVLEGRIAGEVAELEALGHTYEEVNAGLVERREQLAAAYEDQVAALESLDSQIDEFEGELASLARQEQSIRAEIAAAAQPGTPTVSSSGFVRPVPGAVSSGFGMRIHPITGTRRMHNGLDMNAALGEPIRAAKAGRVILAGVKGGYGNTVMIDHGGGMVTLYAHQSKLGVSVGQKVGAGDVIGYAGSTGDSTGPHLHFEVRINGSPVDPAKYL